MCAHGCTAVERRAGDYARPPFCHSPICFIVREFICASQIAANVKRVTDAEYLLAGDLIAQKCNKRHSICSYLLRGIYLCLSLF